MANDTKHEGTQIVSCFCESTYQDKRYGQNKRVHNGCGNPDKAHGTLRCTVCGRAR